MNERLSWMLPSVPLGRIFSTDVRVSWWFALVPLVIWAPKYGNELGNEHLPFWVVSVGVAARIRACVRRALDRWIRRTKFI